MTKPVRVRLSGAVATVTLTGPAAPDLSHPLMRRSLSEALSALARDPRVGVVVLRAEAGWPRLDPLTGLGADARVGAPDPAELAAQIAGLGKPVVACASGRVAGAGLALFLAAPLRLAVRDAVFSCVDLRYGGLPGWGLTQDLPRAIGAGPALALLLGAEPLGAAAAQAAGLLHGVLEGPEDPALAALACALAAGQRDVPPRADRRGNPGAWLDAVAQARWLLAEGRGPRDRVAAEAVIAAVEAALLLPEAEARQHAEVAASDLAARPEARGARAAALALRAAALGPSPARPGDLRRVSVLLSEAAGPGVEVPLLLGLINAGIETRLIGQPGRLAATLRGVATRQELACAAGRLTVAARDAAWDRLVATEDVAMGLGQADVVLLGPGAGLALRAAATAANPRAPLAQLTAVAGDDRTPGVATLDLTAPSGRLWEVTGRGRAEEAAALLALGRRLGRSVLWVGDGGTGPGIAGRLAAALQRAAASLGSELRDGADLAARLAAADPAQMLARPRDLPPEAALARVALVAFGNAALAILSSDPGLSAPQVEAAAIAGWGLPRALGGPLWALGESGLVPARALLRDLAAAYPEAAALWAPVPAWDYLIKNGLRSTTLPAGALTPTAAPKAAVQLPKSLAAWGAK